MSVEYWYSDDSYYRAESSLRRTIGQYACRNNYIYIGLTQQQPEIRFAQHQRKWEEGHKWDKMIVIYHARTFSLMQSVEDRLIKYAEEKVNCGKYKCQVLNDRKSQRPLESLNKNGYWIYVLISA